MRNTAAVPHASHGSWRRWIDLLLIAGTIALAVAFARHVDWASTWRSLRHARVGLLLLAVASDLASIVVKGLRWALLLNAVGARGVTPAIRDTIVGAALNNVVVANGGDAARVAITARRSGASSADVFAALAVERFSDGAAYVALFGALALGIALPGPFAKWSAVAVAGLAATTLLCAWLVSRRSERVSTQRARAIDSEADPSRGVIRRTIATVVRYVRRLAATTASVAAGKRFAIVLILAVIVWTGQWATFHLTARAASLPISAVGSLLALLVVNASFVVRVTPGNVGVFQLLYVLAATTMGVDKGSALAGGLLIQIVQYIPVTFIGLVLAPAFARGRWRRDASAFVPTETDRTRAG
jgi:uncharacterized protein (TIRG00374 family)